MPFFKYTGMMLAGAPSPQDASKKKQTGNPRGRRISSTGAPLDALNRRKTRKFPCRAAHDAQVPLKEGAFIPASLHLKLFLSSLRAFTAPGARDAREVYLYVHTRRDRIVVTSQTARRHQAPVVLVI